MLNLFAFPSFELSFKEETQSGPAAMSFVLTNKNPNANKINPVWDSRLPATPRTMIRKIERQEVLSKKCNAVKGQNTVKGQKHAVKGQKHTKA